jgi:hypothetical protein
MNFTKVAALVLSLGMIGTGIAACSNEPEPVSSDVNVISTQAGQNNQSGAANVTVDANAASENFVFTYAGCNIIINTDIDIARFNDDDYDYDEVPSCAGQGMATEYNFKNGSFFVETYTGNTVVDRIALCDDTVTTAEGIYIGQTIDDVKAAYGEPTEIAGVNYKYLKGSSELWFTFDDNGKIQYIEYRAAGV